MAATFTNSSSVFSPLLARVEQVSKAAVSAVRAHLHRRIAYNEIRRELLSYDDRGLADLGVAYSDIDRIAREGSRDA